MSKKARIPKSAVKSLLECCAKMGEETGRPAVEIFREYLELIKKYADYFDEPWPETKQTRRGFTEKEDEFIEGAESVSERLERFTLVCLRRNISLQGFDSEHFVHDLDFYGGLDCSKCVVPQAEGLRKYLEELERERRRIEEDLRSDEPSWLSKEMADYHKKPEVIKDKKMSVAKLRIIEELGAEGKSCSVKNEFKCPYGENYKELIKQGIVFEYLWTQIRWYDHHHKDEPAIIDVTSFEDIGEAIDDGRFQKIVEMHEKWMKERGAQEWQI